MSAEAIRKASELSKSFRNTGLPVILAAHDNSVTNVFPYLGETGTTEDIVVLLMADGS